MSANYGEYEFNFSTKDGEKDEARAKTAFDWCVEEYDWFEEDGFYLSGNSIKMDGNYCSALGDEGNDDEMKEWLTGMAEASGAEVISGYYISDHTESANEFYWNTGFEYKDGECSFNVIRSGEDEDYEDDEDYEENGEDDDESEGCLHVKNGVLKECTDKDVKSVVIPENVTEIGENAFMWCKSLSSVEIPSSVTEIGKGAFNHCNINELSHPLLTIKNGVAIKDNRVLYCASQSTSVTIPEGVTAIGESAFWGCESLSSVEIPSSVTEIGESAFNRCDLLASVKIPSSVTEIGKGAFYGCESLSSVVIPEGVTKIGGYAFSGCSLSSVVIPSSVTEISGSAFSGCKSLASVVIPSSVTEIGKGAFYGCDSLSSVEFGGTVAQWEAVNGKENLCADFNAKSVKCVDGEWQPVVLVENGVAEKCLDKNATSVTIPEGVTAISGSFYGGAFCGCESLASVEIPPSVTEIGYRAFDGCKSLSSVEFGGTVAQWEAVEGKQNLWLYLNAKCVKCADGEWQKPVVLVENGVAVECLDENATSVTFPEGVTEIGKDAFRGCSSLSSVVIPSSVKKIGKDAFSGCSSLSSVSIPSSVKKIGDGSFYGCESLSSVEFGGTMAQWDAVKGKMWLLDYSPAKSVKCADGEWRKSAIVENGVLVEYTDKDAASVEIPDGVTEIGGLAFRDCSSLESVSIPSSVTKIGEDAFFHCSSLTSIEFGGTVAQWKAVEKVRDWHGGVPAKSLKCADGEAEL